MMDAENHNHPAAHPAPRRAGGRWGLRLLLVAAVGVYLYVAWPRASRLTWSADLTAALQQARTTHRPVLIEFGAAWCEPCQWMEREVLPRREVAAALEAWIPVHIDIDAQPHVQDRYGVEAVPTFVALSPEGRELRRAAGSMPPEQFIAFLRAAAPPSPATRARD